MNKTVITWSSLRPLLTVTRSFLHLHFLWPIIPKATFTCGTLISIKPTLRWPDVLCSMTSIFVAWSSPWWIKTLLSRAFLRPEAIYGEVCLLAFPFATKSAAILSVSCSIAAFHTRNHCTFSGLKLLWFICIFCDYKLFTCAVSAGAILCLLGLSVFIYRHYKVC